VPKLADDDPRKWDYTEHTGAKHEILRRYLDAWYSILGSSRAPQLVILDGFAGRGKYNDGRQGSPVLIHDAAVRAVGRGISPRVRIFCSEATEANFECLSEVVAELSVCPGVEITARHKTFAEAAPPVAKWLGDHRGMIPAFAFVDPFGFTGVPLDVIRSLLAVDRVEVLLTFMARDMGRFLTLDTVEEALNDFFGGDAWKNCVQADEGERTECLLLRYQEVVRPEIARYATPFRVFEDERQTTLYYLVHLTNHPLGMRRMKEAMVAQSSDMTFWPITVRPKDQLALDVAETEPYPSLQKHLLDTYQRCSITFEDLLNDDYPRGWWIEKHYRAAILDLETTEGQPVWVVRPRTTKTGRPPRGLDKKDVVKFGYPA
jgi:three-Cys-motif partner protein